MKKIVAISLTVVMLLTLAIGAFAADLGSPERPGTGHKVTVVSGKGGTADKTVNDDGTITLTANVSDGHKFSGWEISGDFEIVSGSLTDPVIVIRPKAVGGAAGAVSDITATASFDETTPAKPWDGDKSPQTGNMVLPVVFVAFVSLFGCAYAVKRSYNA